ncbi:hypothetical protein AGR4C_Cc130070 [Agrobacterium tumefaciens str. Kerr 14]|uniref:Uncharacterized protein n=1 Tax=Agrobacterium tumefaciens str. Kerr 14 TaxID=1183424 RepID=A0A1S7NY96_AGRTU|nr:hypothetical protein AGR4C_Cc130070 [Agrobacterium tumefaciens str. Kerr 14]
MLSHAVAYSRVYLGVLHVHFAHAVRVASVHCHLSPAACRPCTGAGCRFAGGRHHDA